MKTKQHQQLDDTSSDDTDAELQDDRITAYNDDDTDENPNDDELQATNIQLGTIDPGVINDTTVGQDNDDNREENNINSQESGQRQERQEKRGEGYYYGSYRHMNSSQAFHVAMMRIWDLLSVTTSSFLLYLCMTLNGLFFFIGSLSASRNLGFLWFRADYDEEFEYSFGWNKSHELEGDWTPVGYEDLDGYFDTNIVDAGKFFGAIVIIGLLLLILLALFQACRSSKMMVSANERVTSNLGTGILLGVAFIYFLIYVIACLDFHSEYEDVCGQLIDILDRAHNYYHDQDLDFYECADGWAMYLQYTNMLIYVLSMILFYEVRKGTVAIQVAKQMRLHQHVNG